MSACPHTPKYPDVLSVPSMQDALSRATPADAENDPKLKLNRALTGADGSTRVDNAYWQDLTDAQRAAVMAHETAHTGAGLGIDVSCEGCADKVGGYFMRAWGYAPPIVQQTFASLNVKRKPGMGNTSDNAAAGAHAAERAMASRGLLGLSSIAVAKLRAQQATTKQASAPAATPPLASATTLDPGGPNGAGNTAPAPSNAETLNGSGTVDAAPSTTAPTTGTAATEDHSGGFAGDVVAAVLGDDARPHAVPVLIGAAIAATLAVVLVVIVRHAVAD